MDRDILTIAEVAEYLRVSERTVYEWASKGEVPCGRLGTSWRFKRSEIEEWVNSRLARKKYPEVPPELRFTDILSVQRCAVMTGHTKIEVLSQMVGLLSTAPEVRDRRELERAIFRREQLMSTGIGFGIGLPHARLGSVSDIVLAVGVCPAPLHDYDSLDGEPVEIVVMVAAGNEQHAEHIRALSLVSARLKQGSVRRELARAGTPVQIHAALVS